MQRVAARDTGIRRMSERERERERDQEEWRMSERDGEIDR